MILSVSTDEPRPIAACQQPQSGAFRCKFPYSPPGMFGLFCWLRIPFTFEPVFMLIRRTHFGMKLPLISFVHPSPPGLGGLWTKRLVSGWLHQSLLCVCTLKVILVTLFLQDPGSNAIFLSAFCLEMLTALTSGTCCCDIGSLRRLNEIEADTEDEKSPLV